MFQWISIIGFVLVIAGVVLHSLIFPCGYTPRFTLCALIRKKVHLFTLLFPEQKLDWPAKIRKLVFLLGLLGFCVLAATGFGPLLFGARLHGYLLMIHATFAPVFIGAAAIVAILGAGQYSKQNTGAKAGFWALLVLSLPVTLTMVLSMLPLFGTHGQEILFSIHRWSALIFALLAIIELYILIRLEVLKDTRTQH